jgi:hypothetical protein
MQRILFNHNGIKLQIYREKRKIPNNRATEQHSENNPQLKELSRKILKHLFLFFILSFLIYSNVFTLFGPPPPGPLSSAPLIPGRTCSTSLVLQIYLRENKKNIAFLLA